MAQSSIIQRRQRQYGAASVAIAFLVLFLIAGALATAFGLSGSVVRDATMSAQQAQALFLAESGLARALKRYGNGTLCASLGSDGPYSLGQGNFTVVSGVATDFSGAALPAAQCRVQVNGAVSGVSRTIEGIMQRSTNGFPPQANVNFNQPVGPCVYPGCMPTNWNFTDAGWLDTGGPDSSRAAYISKSASGSGIDISAGGFSFYPPITRVGPSTLKIDVDYKNSVIGGAKKIHVDFWLRQQSPGTAVWTTNNGLNGARINSGDTSGAWLRTGTPTGEASATINLPAGTFRIDRIDFKLTADSGNNYSATIDNISIDGEDTGLTTEEKAVLLSWREVVQ